MTTTPDHERDRARARLHALGVDPDTAQSITAVDGGAAVVVEHHDGSTQRVTLDADANARIQAALQEVDARYQDAV
jgi:membrane carboxypeptidase/penicillin-binding protein PbpC